MTKTATSYLALMLALGLSAPALAQDTTTEEPEATETAPDDGVADTIDDMTDTTDPDTEVDAIEEGAPEGTDGTAGEGAGTEETGSDDTDAAAGAEVDGTLGTDGSIETEGTNDTEGTVATEGTVDTEGTMETDGTMETGVDTEASDELMESTGMSFDDILADLQNDADSAQAVTNLQNLSTDAEVVIVRLADLEGRAGENATALQQSLADREATLLELQSAINANATVRTALEVEGLMTANVVAVHSLEDGGVILIVDEEL